jgi:hypothetical protein
VIFEGFFHRFDIHNVFQKLGIWQSWRPEFPTDACTDVEAGPIRNRVDANGLKIWDANEAKNQFLKHVVYTRFAVHT